MSKRALGSFAYPVVPAWDGQRQESGQIPARADLLPSLRGWQREAWAAYFRISRRDFLLAATPGAGKTVWALAIAAELLAKREIMALCVVTPTEHLKYQWAEAASGMGVPLDASFRNAQGRASADYTGVVVTYAQVAARPALHRQRTERRPTLVIFDEIHHAGDSLSWGEAVREAFEPARRRLAMTGTPFRGDANPIPFVTYQVEADGSRRSSADYSYGYGPALSDGVVRPVIFLAYSGQMRWQMRAGEELAVSLGEPLTAELAAQALRTALDPRGDWVARVIEAADRRLSEIRKGIPDAAGLVIASDRADARAYAALLRKITGEHAVVVLSDDPSASKKIAVFAASDGRWLVAVRMVSEGVDIPRLAVGVYATSVSTAMFFAQAVGRFVRARRRGETASVFLPSVPVLLGYAAELEAERDHMLKVRSGGQDEDLAIARAQQRRDHPDAEEPPFLALAATARFDRVLYDGGEFGASPEDDDFIGLPGLLEPEQVALLLRQRHADQMRKQRADPAGGPAAAATPATARQTLTVLRQELNSLVAAWHHRTGQPHAVIHGELRRACGGPAVPQATSAQISARIDTLRRWRSLPG